MRRVLKSDLRQIAKATGAKIKLSLGVMDEGDKFPAEELGECEVFEQVGVVCGMLLLCSLLLANTEFLCRSVSAIRSCALFATARTPEPRL